MENQFTECVCASPEHTLHYAFDAEDKQLYTMMFLGSYPRFWKRIWIAVKYIFGYKCRYGHWDCFIAEAPQINQIKKFIDNVAEQVNK